jgi:hypothetical protein
MPHIEVTFRQPKWAYWAIAIGQTLSCAWLVRIGLRKSSIKVGDGEWEPMLS